MKFYSHFGLLLLSSEHCEATAVAIFVVHGYNSNKWRLLCSLSEFSWGGGGKVSDCVVIFLQGRSRGMGRNHCIQMVDIYPGFKVVNPTSTSTALCKMWWNGTLKLSQALSTLCSVGRESTAPWWVISQGVNSRSVKNVAGSRKHNKKIQNASLCPSCSNHTTYGDLRGSHNALRHLQHLWLKGETHYSPTRVSLLKVNGLHLYFIVYKTLKATTNDAHNWVISPKDNTRSTCWATASSALSGAVMPSERSPESGRRCCRWTVTPAG